MAGCRAFSSVNGTIEKRKVDTILGEVRFSNIPGVTSIPRDTRISKVLREGLYFTRNVNMSVEDVQRKD